MSKSKPEATRTPQERIADMAGRLQSLATETVELQDELLESGAPRNTVASLSRVHIKVDDARHLLKAIGVQLSDPEKAAAEGSSDGEVWAAAMRSAVRQHGDLDADAGAHKAAP